MSKSPTKVPILKSDDEAEAFLALDLSGLDYTAFKQVNFEIQPKAERVNMRLPATLLRAVKARASKEGIPYQRYIRRALELSLLSDEPGRRDGGKAG
jgi:predicted DNA binding CopG/RHH family protein